MIILTRRRKGESKKWTETLEFSSLADAKQAAFGYKSARIRCDSCAAIMINGLFCHEAYCPDEWRTRKIMCRECGFPFLPESRFHHTCVDCLSPPDED